MPGLTIGDTVPNIQADSTHGKISLYDYIDGSWAIIFSHPGRYPFGRVVVLNLVIDIDERSWWQVISLQFVLRSWG